MTNSHENCGLYIASAEIHQNNKKEKCDGLIQRLKGDKW